MSAPPGDNPNAPGVTKSPNRGKAGEGDAPRRRRGEGEGEGVGLEDFDVVHAVLADFFLGFAEHAAGEIDAINAATAGIEAEGGAGADAQVEDAVSLADAHVGDGAGDSALDEPAEG